MLTQTIERRQGQTWATDVGPWPALVGSVLAVALAWSVERRTRRRRGEASSRSGLDSSPSTV